VTEAELQDIERWARLLTGINENEEGDIAKEEIKYHQHVLALVAEVRRLRLALAESELLVVDHHAMHVQELGRPCSVCCPDGKIPSERRANILAMLQ
jgi:hypothetical protein